MRRAPAAPFLLLLLALPLDAAPDTTPRAPIATVGALADALAEQPGAMPLAVAVGRGFKASPLNASVACMTPDQRAQWWDHHQAASCTDVLVLSEATRVEAAAGRDLPQSSDEAPASQGDQCVVRAEALEPDGAHLVANTHEGVLLPWQCEALAASQAVAGFRLVTDQGRVYFYPPHRVLRLEILPVR